MKKNYPKVTSLLLIITLTIIAKCFAISDAKQAYNKYQAVQADRRKNEKLETDYLVQYDKQKEKILENLSKAIDNNQEDTWFYSPLHTAINIIRIWRIKEAEDKLIKIIDYKIDPASLPVGMDVDGSYFFPVIDTLISLRTNHRKIIEAIANYKNDDQLKLLTWVLHKKFDKESNNILLLYLKKYKRKEQKDKINESIKLIENAKNNYINLPDIHKKRNYKKENLDDFDNFE